MSGIARLIAAVTLSWGWRRLLLACFAGAVSALALAPLFWWPVLFVTLPVLVWMMDGVTDPQAGEKRYGAYLQAFGIGWAFGFGFFLAGLYWIGLAFLVDAEDFAWLLPFVAAALPGGLAIFTGFTTVIARVLGGRGFTRCLMLASSWVMFEAARGVIFSGFPWNRLGQVFAGSDQLIQGAAYVGDLGLTFLVIVIFTAPATLADRTGFARGWRGACAAVCGLALLWAAGAYRLSLAGDVGQDMVEGVRLRIVQPAIAQVDKWKPEKRSQIIADYLELSDAATSPQTMGIEQVTHLIWPETALPLLLEREEDVVAAIAALLPAETVLLTGGVRVGAAQGGRRKVYNSVLAINGDGQFLSAYDKHKLVPFGEYLPFQVVLEGWGLAQLTRLPGGFTPGKSQRTMKVGAAPSFVPLICYEIIFSGEIVPDADADADGEARPGWILNLTNDAWFGESSGPHQHLAQARLRALEEGLPVIRAANTGISIVFDAYGRTVGHLELGQRGVIDVGLPGEIAQTFYSKYRKFGFVVLILVIVAAQLLEMSSRRARSVGRR